MPSKSEPCTWTMSAVQLITSTTSALAVIDAIQAMITASTNWRVVSTGFTASNKKYVEVAPLLSSNYKNMRVLFLETAINSTSKQTHDNVSVANRLAFCIYPDGGASYCTFTPANLESGGALYVGTKYNEGWWGSMSSPYTALWMYECNGAMWIVCRSAGTSHQLFGFGQVSNFANNWKDWSEDGTELGIMGLYSNHGITTSIVTGNDFLGKWGSCQFVQFRRADAAATGTLIYISNWSGATPPKVGSVGGSYGSYNTTTGAALFTPLGGGHSDYADQGFFAMRGMYGCSSLKTRTTIKNSTGATTLGYTFYPDDIATGWSLCWMNI